MSRRSVINYAMAVAADVFNGEYLWYIGSCLTTAEEEETKEETRKAFRTLRQYGLSYKEVKLHVERQENKEFYPLPFIDRIFISKQWTPVETDELPF